MGRNWAITIGINRYSNLQSLQFAKRDAEQMREFFSQEIHFEQVYHFTDDSPPIPQDHGPDLDSRPTYATLRRFLRVRFEKDFLRAGDNLWFFFAGHGVNHEDRDYLMPIDADPGDVESTAIPLHYVTERLSRSGADNVILLVDACRSRGGRGLGVGNETQKGVITLFACSPKETSYEIEDPAIRHGAFTHTLLEGLRIQGEGNCATVERLNQHLRHQVPLLNERYGKPRQTPYCKVEPLAKSHLILLPKSATQADISALKLDAYQAESRQDYRLAKQFWIRVLAVWPADPDAIEGIERLALVSATNPPVVPTQPVSDRSVERGGQSVNALPAKDKLEVVSETLLDSGNPQSSLFELQVVTVDAKGNEKSRQTQQVQGYVEELGNGIVLEMASIPGGRFQMGSPPEELERNSAESSQHHVDISTFWMGKYAVTQSQWKTVASWAKVKIDLKADPSVFKGKNRPVEKINWNEAVEFCARLSVQLGREYRLPSEAEWEYACRGGTTTPFHFGETISPTLANYDGTFVYGQGPKGKYRKETTEVGSYGVGNGFGLYDMHGNVWEWCLDPWHENYEGAPSDGSAWVTGGDSSYQVLRGGSWYDFPRSCRSANRYRNNLGSGNSAVGLRVVCVMART